MESSQYTPQRLRAENPLFFAIVHQARNLDDLRLQLSELALQLEFNATQDAGRDAGRLARIRDCAKVLKNLLKRRSDQLAGFSVTEAIADIGSDIPRPDLSPAFCADLHHILKGLQGNGPRTALEDIHLAPVDHLHGRQAALERSRQLDELRLEVDRRMTTFPSGLSEEAIRRRQRRRAKLMAFFNASEKEWQDWRWQTKNIVRDGDLLGRLIPLDRRERQAIDLARRKSLPFGITPHYLSLMDDARNQRDRAIRAQVIPPLDYVQQVSQGRESGDLDFMGEEDTSPADLITRRYPAILILKPFNTCPQICVYCQRNWEIDDAMAPGAYAGRRKIDEALAWIRAHPAIHEVLVTGGDPLAMGDGALGHVLEGLAAIPTVERIRIGSRTVVTMPMRITAKLARLLASFREPGRREVALTTHVQHPYELTPEVITAVERLRRHGIAVYNQLVYTFFVSRRFEAAALRRTLRLCGIDPYYTFNPKGKEETAAYRVPIARLLQEQYEEARLLPGLERTDEAVFNVPRQGKNYLKSREHRDLISILPNGQRVYEFHPWERNIAQSSNTYIHRDVPILSYLERLAAIGEDPDEYATIWFYF